ncbi:MAG: DUF3179 domain-containing protein [Actinomycetota bacterium]|nr:DUF3179 domain-containing protein [Actinomycetota bacterium]
MTRTTMLTVLAAIALIAAACSTSVDGSATEEPTTEALPSTTASTSTTATADAPVSALPSGPSALDDPESAEFPEPLVPLADIISGGPPPDGIPPIDDPVFLDTTDNLEILDPSESVVALEINGDARAYPIRAMIWHEIVNDTVGGVPVSVTYCPLCNSAVTYRREINGVETTFGTSGRLFASALVMYDRATESLWTHFDGKAVVGVLTGTQLEAIGSPLMAWGDFAAAYPSSKVLDWTATGFDRPYGQNPYEGYDDDSTQPFLFRGALDDRGLAKQRVVGISLGDEAVAYDLNSLSDGEASATNITVATRDLVIFWKAGQASALDEGILEDGRDVGSTGVFSRIVDGRTLTFVAEGEQFVDEETGSTWIISGEAISGTLEGARLERIEHLDTFWFAWSTYQPDTVLIEG